MAEQHHSQGQPLVCSRTTQYQVLLLVLPQAPGEIGAGTGIGKKRIEDENEISRQMKLNAKKWERYRRGGEGRV